MKRFGSSRPTACPEDGGKGLRVSIRAMQAGPRVSARARVGASLDYGAGVVAALQGSNSKQ
ncbi:hypothetical protein ACLMLE_18095 [Lysobacter capsici]|jgi:hypothetical protein